ncbi:MAG: hypothetical protein H0U62_04480 [Actinobacteria bacterium]|nr:hypothetical protein [Actinomycetota bacterium]
MLDEAEFDELLRQGAPVPTKAASETAILLAQEMVGQDAGVAGRRRPRRSWVTAAAAVGTLALAGAGTVTAYQLSLPPFQGLEQGVQRVETGIPVTYTNSLGREVDCLAFIEYRNLDEEQEQAIERIRADARWDGYGQRVLEALGMPNATPEAQNEAVGEVVHEDLWEAAHATVPEMVYVQNSDGPVYNGSSMSCANPGGVDGRP